MAPHPPEQVDSPSPHAPPKRPTPPGPRSPEEKAQRVALWKQILSGEQEPEVLVVPAEVEEVLRIMEARLLSQHGQTMTAEARRRTLDDLCLQYFAGGHPVGWMQTPRGPAVLAWGEHEVSALETGVPTALRRPVRVEYPDPW